MSWDDLVGELGEMFGEYTYRISDVDDALVRWSQHRLAQQQESQLDPWKIQRRRALARTREKTPKYRAMKRANRAKHREKYRAERAAYTRAWRAKPENKIKQRRSKAVWREKNRERLREYKRAWNAKRYGLIQRAA